MTKCYIYDAFLLRFMGYYALILVSFYLVLGEWEISEFADLLIIC